MKKRNKKALLISLIIILSMVVSTIYPTVSYASELEENSHIQSGSTNSSTGDEKVTDNKKPEQTPEEEKPTDNKNTEQIPEEEKPAPPSIDKPRKPSSSSDTDETVVINPPVPPLEDVVNPPIPEVVNPPIPPSEDVIEKPVKQIVPIPEVVKPSVSEEKNDKVKDDTVINPPVPPKTGDNTIIIGEILLVLGAIVGLIILRRNKNTN
ncbi:hypothetical protein [Clostridioides sp. ZZV15-6383]|uniref:hypothetical protein n=1 Tax=Clostridioides sp. ZZV15-6383 TaxID=2811498 RepID=UPI0039BD5CF6